MKEAVEEGLRFFIGQRLRVSLSDCSVERLQLMLTQIDSELTRLKAELERAEQEVLELYGSAENVKLEYTGGQYLFPLDNYREELVDLRNRIEDLFEKRKPIYQAYQERYLEDRQAKILGSKTLVHLKDKLIFGLIIVVLVLLGIDVGNFGAMGEGAKLKPVVRGGEVISVNIVDGGRHYQAAHLRAFSKSDKTGSGFQAVLSVGADGKISGVEIDSRGNGYQEELLELKVIPVLTPKRQHQLWLVDFICCMVFLSNFIFELILSASKRWYWKTHWIDFITSIPLPPAQVLAGIGLNGSEVIRAGRLLRIMRVLRALRALRIFLLMWRGLDHFAELLDVQLMKKSFGVGLVVLLAGAVLITLFGEKGEGHEAVEGFLPGLWWSFTTLVTGGFGDIYNPHTLLGRILTVFLVIAGMVLVGVFTATLTTILVGKEERAQSAMQNELLDSIQKEGARTEAAISRVEERQQQIGGRINELEEKLRDREDGQQ